tara:strand:+ start:854 stop:1804 length:951 start_codon:yes stop_codon:yes gene_type:complete
MQLELRIRPFQFNLIRPLQTAAGMIKFRRGWLLRLRSENGRVGWGEAAPLNPEFAEQNEQALRTLPSHLTVQQLEELLPQQPMPVAFAIGAALAELDGIAWLPSPAPAQLLPAGEAMLEQLKVLEDQACFDAPLAVKWKVAVEADAMERRWLDQLLERLPSTAQLRLDANGGWNRVTAQQWMEALLGDPRFTWLEQPLSPEDQQGLESLSQRGPVALDESLELDPSLRDSWPGWQVRRPSLEGDPRPLLRQLQQGAPWRMVSTAFETGIGRRWLDHLAALQMNGPTPAAPGLAPGWCPVGPLFSADPQQVWAAAAI